MYTRSKTGNSG